VYSFPVLPLDCGQDFDPAREQEFFAAIPARPAVVLVEPRQTGARPYLLRTADLKRRLERLLRLSPEPTKRLNLREFAARVRYRLTGSSFEQDFLLYQHARELFPRRARVLLRLRPPALLKVNLAHEYPRCCVTRRIRVEESTGRIADGSFYFGPFPTRKAAEAFSNEFLNLFKIRRCRIRIRRDPSFPGCIYSEIKMCLAPCFAGCSKAEYDVEVGRVVGFLATSGGALVDEFERERKAASESLDFERAAALHRRLEKVAEVLRGLPELARKVDELHAVILQPAAEENAVALFVVRGGRIADPFFLRFGELASQPRSVEQILRERLHARTAGELAELVNPEEHGGVGRSPEERPQPDFAGAPLQSSGAAAQSGDQEGGRGKPHPGETLAEHLALLSRWFYSKPRQGEIFFPGPDWPYRRIIRACSRLLAPPTSLPLAPNQERALGST
jgi:excinuclease ABC subunit C